MQTVWVTKYALTHGIFEAEVIEEQNSGLLIKCDWAENGRDTLMWHEWRRSKGEALSYAYSMRADKIASLEKQIERLRALEF